MPKLPPLLFPSIGYYQRIIAGDEVDYTMRYDKRLKDTHRYTIAGTRGPLQLTVPIEHIWNGEQGGGERPVPLTWGDIPLSTHNQWWDKHRVALESAYGRTPYFEFYIDRLLPLLSADTPQRIPSVAHLCRRANEIVTSILMVDTLRGMATDGERMACDSFTYPQIREDRLGFIPGLSVLDLIFSVGPESPLYLERALLCCKNQRI